MEPPTRKKKQEKKQKDLDDTYGIDFASINAKNDFETVTFEFLEPDAVYASNVYSLLQKTFGFFTGDLYELVECVCQQKEFGNFLSVEGGADDPPIHQTGPKKGSKSSHATPLTADKDVYGLLSIIKLNTPESTNVSKYLSKNILDAFGDKSEAIKGILGSSKGVGLLLCERVINLPFIVVPQMYDQLLADKDFIDHCPDYLPDERLYYEYDYVIYFSKSQEKAIDADDEGAPVPKGGQEKTLYKKEDKILAKNAVLSHPIPSTKYTGISVTLLVLKSQVFWGLVKSHKLFV
jgi:hypothetical protein